MEKEKTTKKGTRQQSKREEKPVNKAKNQKKKIEESDDESSDIGEVETVIPIQKRKPQSRFAMLPDDDEDDDNKSSSSEDSEPEPIIPEKPAIQNTKKQPPKKGGKENQKEEEDFDAILAEFSEKPAKQTAPPADKKGKKPKKGAKDVEEVTEIVEPREDTQNGTSDHSAPPQEQKKLPEIRADMTADELAQIYEQMNMEDEDDDDSKRKKKKGKKQQQQKTVEKETPKSGDEESEEDEEEEDGSTVKSAAQKKKEKKERQKAEKMLKAQQAKAKPAAEKGKKDGTPLGQEDHKKPEVHSASSEASAKPEAAEEENQPSKKDKKKKKADVKEDEKTKKSNKMVSKILEAQKLLKEEEERKRREEEEKIRKEEEEQRLREEKDRLEKEKKERKKQKEKERIKRLKAEGKFLTEKQKEDRKRAQQMLESYKAQGVEVVLPTEKIETPVIPEETPQEKQKRVVYTRKPKVKVQRQTSSGTPSVTSPDAPSVTTPTEAEQKQLVSEPAEEDKEDVKDNWDDSSSDSDDDSQASGTPEAANDVAQNNTTNQTSNVSDSSKEEDEDDDEVGDDDDEDDVSSSDEEDEDDGKTPHERAKEKALAAIEKQRVAAEKAKSADKLRAPVICVLGHVDTGKTKILDKLRRSHVQDGEAGGITQQIGATNVPHHSIKEQIKMCKEIDLKIPGLLIIDTPGHESFSNLRTRGSSLCDIAILIVDIMHGLEAQTIESINILKQKKTPFVVALNKIDRLFGWVTNCHADIVNQLKKQKPNTKMEFDERAKHIIVQFAEQGLNARLFYENTRPREFISLVPTSAITGDGVGNLIALVCELTQSMMLKRIMYSDELQATVMEVKAIPGHGTTIDVILVNGKLTVGNTIVVAGQEGPIVTQVRSLLLPPPMQEIRVKSNFETHKEVVAAQGCKIAAKDLEKAIAGLPLYVAHSPEEVEIYKEELSQMLKDVLSDIKVSDKGVYVQASTLGSLEALLSYLKSSKIAFSGINIGPVHKRDVMKTMAMLEHDPLFACILAFDVKVEKDAQEMAESNNIQIFQADIIYHLTNDFMAFRERYFQQKQEEFKHVAMFPCKLKIMPEHIFNSRDPIICGVVVEAGFVKEGTILCVPSKNFVELGRVSSLEVNHKQVEKATKGMEVCIKIDPIPGDAPKMVGRHFEVTDEIVSKISRNSIDAVKNWFRDEMDRAAWQLILELKKIFGII